MRSYLTQLVAAATLVAACVVVVDSATAQSRLPSRLGGLRSPVASRSKDAPKPTAPPSDWRDYIHKDFKGPPISPKGRSGVPHPLGGSWRPNEHLRVPPPAQAGSAPAARSPNRFMPNMRLPQQQVPRAFPPKPWPRDVRDFRPPYTHPPRDLKPTPRPKF